VVVARDVVVGMGDVLFTKERAAALKEMYEDELVGEV